MKQRIALALLSLTTFVSACSETVNIAPVARLTVPENARVNKTLVFDASASTDAEGTIAAYRFDFGDGSDVVKGVARTEHLFEKAGSYSVTLTVIDKDGARGVTRVDLVVGENRAPVAVLNGPVLVTVGQLVSFDSAASIDEDGAIVSQEIDFGDGSAKGKNPAENHVYKTAGDYKVVLTVTDNEKATGTLNRTIQVQTGAQAAVEAPLARLLVASDADATESLTFDASASTTPGGTAAYKVYYGDGASDTGRSVNHAYAAAGNYTAVLMVTATYADGSTAVTMDARQIRVRALNASNPLPVAAFAAPASARFGATVILDGSASLAPGASTVVYAWNFGDAGTSANALTSHSYASSGYYSIQLTVTATYADGTQSTSVANKLIYVSGNVAPVAALSAPATGLVSNALLFSAAGSLDSDGVIVSSTFDFGDASGTASGPDVVHTYAAAGNYTVTLTVVDNDGASHVATKVVRIDNYNTVAISPSALLNGPTRLVSGQTGAFTVAGSAAPGAVATYKIYFGDGATFMGAASMHSYSATGNYLAAVLLIATYPDATSNTSIAYLPLEIVTGSSANVAPVADFTAPSSVRFGQTAAFDAGLSTAPGATTVAYSWDFGDGNVSTGAAATNVFATGGTYLVVLNVTATYGDGSVASAQRTRIVQVQFNQAPIAVLTGPTQGVTSTPVSFDGSQSADADGSLVSTVLDFGDGSPTVNFLSASHAYSTPGNYTVSLTVTDNDGDSNISTHSLSVSSVSTTFAAPSVAVAGPTDLAANEEGLFSVTGTAPGATLAYRIDFGDGVIANTNSAYHAYAAAANYMLVASVVATYSDATTRWASTELAVRVQGGSASNPAPTASFTAPASVRFTSPVVVDANSSLAPNAASISYNWNFGDGNTGSGVSAVHTYAAASGTFPIQLTVVATYADATTAFSQSTKIVMLVANVIPYANFTGPTQSIVGETVSFDSSSSSDSDGQIASRLIDFGDGATSANTVASHTFAASGTYQVQLTITDNDGATALMVRDIRVLTSAQAGNTPVARIQAPASGLPNTIVTLDGSGSTAETGYLTSYFWELGDGRSFVGASSVNVTYATRGTYTFALTVTNSAGLSNRIERQISIMNSAPTLASAALNAGPHYKTSLIQVTPSGWYDADGDAPQYRYRWVVNGIEVAGETGSSLTGLFFSKGATVQAEVTPYDSYNFGMRAWSNVTTIDNSAPSLASADLGGTVFYEADTLTVTPTGWADADGDAANYSYQWYVNSAPVLGATTASLTGADFSKGDSVYVAVTPDDQDPVSNNLGLTVNSATVVIQNSLPAITSAGIGAGPYTKLDTIAVASVSGWSDADGDTQGEVYQWFVNGAAVSGEINSTLSGANFAKTNTVFVRVWPYDGEGVGAFVDSNTVTIANALPVMASVSLNAGPYVEASTLTATPSATDADADALTYSYDWFVNGVSSGITANNITGANFNKGDTVFVRVTPNDPASGSSMDSATVTIGNTAPTLTSATIASIGNPAYGTDATFYVNSWTGLADADAADTLSLHYQWKVNGAPVVGQTARTLSGVYVVKGDSVTVDVIAFDGTVEGSVRTAGPATVINTPPSLVSVDFGTGPFYEGNTLTAVDFGYNDADGDAAGVSNYRWFINGVFAGGGSAIGTGFAKGNTVTVSAAPFDGTAYGAYVIAPAVTIQNSRPVMDTLTISEAPSPATQGSTISYTASSHDADASDTVSYQRMWIVNGTATGITATTLTGASFNKNDVVTLRITPYDGTDVGTPLLSNSLAIQNTPPTQAGITLFPSMYTLGDGLYVAVTTAGTDIDPADTVTYTYQWFKDGVDQGYPNTQTDVSGALIGAQEVWKVVVTPTDGFASGATSWATKTIPPLGIFTAAGSLVTGRVRHTATLLPNGKVLIAGGDNGGALSSAELYDPATDTFTATGSLNAARTYHTASLLSNGKVLIAGGFDGVALASAELYDPATGVFTPTANPLGAARYIHTATVLPNGKVLIAGGWNGGNLAGAELYDPATDTFTATTGPLGTARNNHKATLLPNGKVLITGGFGAGVLDSAELYDPATDTFTATTGLLGTARLSHTATLLSNGKVLIAGGDNGGALASAELYDPATELFTATAGPLSTARNNLTATPLPNGKVLIAAGDNSGGALASAELYDPATDTFIATGSLGTARSYHTATLLPNGKVLMAGGNNGGSLASAELYDPQDPSPKVFAATDTLTTARELHTSTLLPDGTVLIAGGSNGAALSSAEIYYPNAGTFGTANSLVTGRSSHTATLLPNGKVLIAGGFNGGALASAELYDPATGTFTATAGPMGTARYDHTATLLLNGKVLIAAGTGGGTSAELYDPATDTFTATAGPLGSAREYHTATLLPNGTVLIAGGWNGGNMTSAELYDPATDMFTATGPLGTGRNNHKATLLPNGKALITGGFDGGASTIAELYDPATGMFTATSGVLGTGRLTHTATLLPNGLVLIAGGDNGGALASAELYDPATEMFTATAGPMGTVRNYHTATLLPNGKVLISGGEDGVTYLNSAELFR